MISLPAYFTRFGSRSDGSASLSFTSQEISSETFAELKNNLNNFGYLLFKESPIQDSDIPTGDFEDKEKTPSKRLRACLFVLWRQRGEKGDYETFYRESMEKFISHIKEKLD